MRWQSGHASSTSRIKAATVAERAHLDVALGVAHKAAAVRGQLHNAHTLQAANKVLVAVAEAVHERRQRAAARLGHPIGQLQAQHLYL